MRAADDYLRAYIALCAVFTLAVVLSSCHKRQVAAPPPSPPPPARAPAGTGLGQMASYHPAPPPAPTVTLTAGPSTVESGQSVTLSWTSLNAVDLDLEPGVGKVQAQGSTSVVPQDSTTYTITATGPGGAQSATARVTVVLPPPPPPPPPIRVSEEEPFSEKVGDVFFDRNYASIRNDAEQTLEANARLLNEHPDVTFTIEGYADDPGTDGRGTEEYNLELGDRRATAVRNALVMLGVSPDRIQTISYGRDRPLCAERTESCRQRNRRAHFHYGFEMSGAAAARRSRRMLLVRDELEPAGYGLYSYILFSEPPTSVDRARYKKLIQIYLGLLETKKSEAPSRLPSHPAPPPAPVAPSQQPVLPSRLSVMFLPVNSGYVACLSEKYRIGVNKDREDCFLDHAYDYSRAANLLAELDAVSKPQIGHIRGPYLISSLVPIDAIKRSSQLVYLQQDLSDTPDSLMELHVNVLEQEAASPATSGRRWFDAVALRLRDRIGAAAPGIENVTATIALIWGKNQ